MLSNSDATGSLAGKTRAGKSLLVVKSAATTFAAAVFALLAAVPALALNPIHESSYALLPRGKTADGATFSVAGILDSRADDSWRIPLSLA
ncbi:MAG TPA: hypothetical protein VK465_10070, partial [Fibrobacteria bacterium]|nr:hypothetical protein [Fibrobacteria bacterium]